MSNTELSALFEQFVQEKEYVQGCAKWTLKGFRMAFNHYRKVCPDTLPKQENLQTFIIEVRKRTSAKTTNIYRSYFNSFLTWLFQHEYIPRIRIPKVKEEKKVQPQYSEEEIKRLIAYRPKYDSMKRLHGIICLIVDCGLRIDEALSLKTYDVDFQNLLIKVMGKGSKERIVPMSPELRKVLFKFKSEQQFFFPTRTGVKINYNNLLKDMRRYCRACKVPYKAFHGLRRASATSFVRHGGDVFALQRMLGHSDIATTKIYVNLDLEDIRRAQLKTSILSKFR